MIDLTRDGPVFVARFDAGQNRIDPNLVLTLNTVLDEVERSEPPAALVTTGTDRHYSTGLDLDFLQHAGEAVRDRFALDLHRLLSRILVFPVGTVAALNGHTIAAGAILALAHDFQVMNADAGLWCVPAVDVGIPYPPGMADLVRARVPVRSAHLAMITGRRFDASQAAELSFVDRAVPGPMVLDEAKAMAEEISGKDRATMTAIKARAYRHVLAALRQSAPLRVPGQNQPHA